MLVDSRLIERVIYDIVAAGLSLDYTFAKDMISLKVNDKVQSGINANVHTTLLFTIKTQMIEDIDDD